jgi:hypothetical protein
MFDRALCTYRLGHSAVLPIVTRAGMKFSYIALSREEQYMTGSTPITSENGAGLSIAARTLVSLASASRRSYRVTHVVVPLNE